MDQLTLPVQLQAFIEFILISPLFRLYLISVALLVIGMLYEIWSRSVSLSFLKDTPLSTIEKTHPYLPRLSIVATLCISLTVLLFVALQTVTGLLPYDRPATWIGLGVLFLLFGSCSLLLEMRIQKNTYHVTSSFILGTSLALLLHLFQFMMTGADHLPVGLVLFALVLVALGLVWRLMQWSGRTLLIAAAVFFSWVIYLMRL